MEKHMKYEKLVCFDLDGTLSEGQSWERLNVALGMTAEQDYELYKQYNAGKLDYNQWMQRLVAAYSRTGESHRDIMDRLYDEVAFFSGAEKAVRAVQARGYQTVLVSGSIDIYVQHAADRLGIESAFACSSVVFDADGFVSQFSHSGDEHTAKLRFLESVARDRGLLLDQCVCVADGPNDLDMFLATGKGITFPGTEVEQHAWKVIDSVADLPQVL